MSSNLISFYSGSGIGLLIGVLMGIAVSPTVGVIIGALSSILAVLLGLNDKHFSQAKAIRIGSFGFACVLGVFLGIFVRAHNLLSPGIADMKAEYTSVGFDSVQANDFIAFREFGILNKDWKMAPSSSDTAKGGGISTSNLAQLKHASVLFAADVNFNICDELVNTTEKLPLKEILNNFKNAEGFWKKLAVAIEKGIDTKYQAKILIASKNAICKAKSEKITDTQCAKLSGIDSSSDLDQIKKAFTNIGGAWQIIFEDIASLETDDQIKQKCLIILKERLCETEKKGEK